MIVEDYTKAAVDAKAVISGMIVSDRVCGAVSEKWTEEGLFDSGYLDRLGGWCVDHYRKFHKAPGKEILVYHRRHAMKKSRPDEESQALEALMADISAEYVRKEAKRVQPDYVIHLATDLFTAVKVRKLADRAKDLVSAGKLDRAVAELAKADKVDMTSEDMVDVFTDKLGLETAFAEAAEPLVTYPGAAGHFFKNRLRRRAFVCFEGPEKRGKSFWLMDVAVRAIQQGRRVAYFECGDMPKEDVYLRLAARASGRPVDPEECEEGGVYRFPISLEPSPDGRGRAQVVHEERVIRGKLPVAEAWKAFQRVANKCGGDSFKLACHPTKTLAVSGLVDKLDRLKTRKRWVADVVIVDYADILAPAHGVADTRDQINHTWAMLRSLAMSHDCLVVTATQTNRGSYSAEVIDMEHASEDKRKRSHVTFSVGINQDEEDKADGLFRLNPVVARTGAFDRRKCLVTAACLNLANPMVRCCY